MAVHDPMTAMDMMLQLCGMMIGTAIGVWLACR